MRNDCEFQVGSWYLHDFEKKTLITFPFFPNIISLGYYITFLKSGKQKFSGRMIVLF